VPHVLPPGAQAVIGSVVRSAPNSTAALVAALQPLVDLGLTPEQAAVLGMGRFPVGGLANFSDDWLEPRFDGYFHFHHGTDVFAQGGLPVRAPADGTLRQSSDTLGGTAVYVTEADGTYYYMAHLSAYVEGEVTGQPVKAGDVIGFVGNSGDAQGGATHVHFEIHPNGGGPVDPKPFLDQWLADALAAAPALVNSVRAAKDPASIPVSLARVQAIPADTFAGPGQPALSQLLWASAASPQGGTLQLAEAAANDVMRSIDWSAMASADARSTAAMNAASAAARSVGLPLLPSALQPMLQDVNHISLIDHR
jgi:hypothetical protein